jgi:hypothetical protein
LDGVGLFGSGQLGLDRSDGPALVVEPADQSTGIRPVVSVRCIGPKLPQVIGNHRYRVPQGDAATTCPRLVAHRTTIVPSSVGAKLTNTVGRAP